MVEVTKPGKKPEDRVRRCTCRVCSTEFTFKQSEAHYEYDSREGDYLLIPCPLCRGDCTVAVNAPSQR